MGYLPRMNGEGSPLLIQAHQPILHANGRLLPKHQPIKTLFYCQLGVDISADMCDYTPSKQTEGTVRWPRSETKQPAKS